MNKYRYKTQGTRCKVQGARYKAQGFFLASCSLSLASAQRGFSLVSAIFLLVVIAALGTFAVTLSTTQQQSAALDVQGARAFQAARAGIEWGAHQVLRSGGCPASPQVLPALPNTLANFNVRVVCNSVAAQEGSAAVNMYQLTSTAWQGAQPSPNYVERQMTVTIAG